VKEKEKKVPQKDQQPLKKNKKNRERSLCVLTV
jgi:hypothetical protein